ncbi:phosphoglycolate phosphatase-like HAD superfamily hydrolase [Elusimicrobium posterum]|uniref:HAD family hydrolase n=1 Tax=Elusimicrobium posterum TaxID=3116653 RepID=UPI003C75706B
MSKLVMFDLDGTLVRSGLAGKIALDKAIKNLFGKTADYDISLLNGNTDSKNFTTVFEHVMKRKIKPAELKKLKEEYIKILPSVVKDNVKNKKYEKVAGIDKFIAALLKQKDVYLALGTGNFEEAATIKLQPSGLDKHFKTGGFGEASADRAEMLAHGVERASKHFKIKFNPEDVFIIGDTHKDVVAAKANGYHSGVVTGRTIDAHRLQRAAAEIEMEDFNDIDTWFIWLDLTDDPKGVNRGHYILPASPIEHVFFSRTGIDEEQLKKLRVKKYHHLPSGKLFK